MWCYWDWESTLTKNNYVELSESCCETKLRVSVPSDKLRAQKMYQ